MQIEVSRRQKVRAKRIGGLAGGLDLHNFRGLGLADLRGEIARAFWESTSKLLPKIDN